MNEEVYIQKVNPHIHSMTLKSFIRERVEKGLETNLDLFGAFVARTAEIKPKRRK